ncbi:hypothetical protein DPMN_144418 [Dreissena polymorpha]|uniref:Uncharacterized protein n=1 Tax=Dreissena polymorpha TaxID=45954 RepID=A0A9D4GL20_DREPO|nr:hypothetical protein DPMN_144418 [Dreissena polymorpha]
MGGEGDIMWEGVIMWGVMKGGYNMFKKKIGGWGRGVIMWGDIMWGLVGGGYNMFKKLGEVGGVIMWRVGEREGVYNGVWGWGGRWDGGGGNNMFKKRGCTNVGWVEGVGGRGYNGDGGRGYNVVRGGYNLDYDDHDDYSDDVDDDDGVEEDDDDDDKLNDNEVYCYYY